MYDIRIVADHLAVRVFVTVSHPDGTREYEGLGSNLGEALQELADNVQAEEY
jgi:hypothetical protein